MRLNVGRRAVGCSGVPRRGKKAIVGDLHPGSAAFRSGLRRLGVTSGRHVLRRGGRVVDRVALEMRSTGNRTGGSNPSLSAT